MNNDFGKYQELVNNWAKKNDMIFVLPEFLDLFKQIEKEGHVEGAISELKIIIKRNSNFKYSRLDMIEFCEKRLVELEKELK